jgi:energy-coupling factor transport system permease protein
MRDIAFGQYIPGNSIVHRLDPRSKLLFLIAYIVLIFCTFNYYALAIPLVLAVAIMLLSKVPVKQYLKSMKMILIVVILTSILNLFYGGGRVLLSLGPLSITEGGINNSVVIVTRILCLIIASAGLTFTTSPNDLTYGIERLMSPLKVFHIKVHEIAMMMTIALRFVPTLLEETDKIMLAQKSRGADMESGGIVQRAKALIPVLIPLFVSAFRRAFDLAMAMECRCYNGGEGRTRMKVLHFHTRDIAGFVFFGFVIAGIVLCDVFLPHIVR